MQGCYDLHVHSTFSDGSLTPYELIDLASSIGLRGFSITDHDTASAYSEEVFSKAKEKGLDLITGVEFSTYERETSIHVLGYGFDYRHTSILNLSQLHKSRRRERNEAILNELAKHDMQISIEELYKEGLDSVGRPHIGMLMVQKGYVESLQEAFEKWIGDKRSCFVKGQSFSVKETIATIHEAGGKAVLAHPILIRKKSAIRSILSNFNGLECYYANFPESKSKEMLRLAERYHLIPTGGSDFHSHERIHNRLGSSYTTFENLEKLLKS